MGSVVTRAFLHLVVVGIETRSSDEKVEAERSQVKLARWTVWATRFQRLRTLTSLFFFDAKNPHATRNAAITVRNAPPSMVAVANSEWFS